MRLIDADELIKDLKIEIPLAENVEIFIDIIKGSPTAYDVDKVVEQLKDRSKEYNSGVRLHGKPEDIITNEAIEIVKGGGLDA